MSEKLLSINGGPLAKELKDSGPGEVELGHNFKPQASHVPIESAGKIIRENKSPLRLYDVLNGYDRPGPI